MLTISPSTAACERAFSHMNLCKTPQRSCLSQDNLQHQMRIVINGPSLDAFEPTASVLYWLKSGKRHIIHKNPKKSSSISDVSESAATPSTSDSITTSEAKRTESLDQLKDVVKMLGGEDVAVQKLKEFQSNQPGQCIVM